MNENHIGTTSCYFVIEFTVIDVCDRHHAVLAFGELQKCNIVAAKLVVAKIASSSGPFRLLRWSSDAAWMVFRSTFRSLHATVVPPARVRLIYSIGAGVLGLRGRRQPLGLERVNWFAKSGRRAISLSLPRAAPVLRDRLPGSSGRVAAEKFVGGPCPAREPRLIFRR